MKFRCEADLQAFRIAAVAGAADVDPAGRVRDPRSGLALQRPWRIAHAAGSGPGGVARWEPGAATARSGADEGAAEGPRRPAVAALRLLRVRRSRRAWVRPCHPTDPGCPCGMPGAGRGLRAAGWRRRVGRNPGQGAGGRRARPGKADVPGEVSGRGKRTERLGDLRNVRHRARGQRERLPAGAGLFPARHGAFGRSSARTAGSTARFRAASPNPIRSWPDTNPAAAALWFRSSRTRAGPLPAGDCHAPCAP